MENAEKYLPLVKKIAKGIYARLPNLVELEDLVGAGTLSLLSAILQYDASKGVPFEKYAEIRIKGGIIDEIRKASPVSRGDMTKTVAIESIRHSLLASLGRPPSEEEMANAMGLSLSSYIEMITKTSPIVVIGIEDMNIGEEGRNPSDMLADMKASDPIAEIRKKELSLLIGHAIDKLTPRRRQVILLHYYENLQFIEIAELLSLTEGRVSQLHKSALNDLKKILEDYWREYIDLV